jgi:hypothetical protein
VLLRRGSLRPETSGQREQQSDELGQCAREHLANRIPYSARRDQTRTGRRFPTLRLGCRIGLPSPGATVVGASNDQVVDWAGHGYQSFRFPSVTVHLAARRP